MHAAFQAYVTPTGLNVMQFSVRTPHKKFTATAVDELLTIMGGVYESLRTQKPKSVCMVFDFTGVEESRVLDPQSLSFAKRFSSFCTAWDNVTEPATKAVILVVPSVFIKQVIVTVETVKKFDVPVQAVSTTQAAEQALAQIGVDQSRT